MKSYRKFLTTLFIGFCFGILTTQAQNKSLLFTANNTGSQLAGVRVANQATLNFTTALTIEAWIKPIFSPDFFRGTIVSKDNWFGNINTGYVLRCGGAGVLDFTYGTGGTSSTTTWQSFTSVNNVLTANVWQHVAVTFAQNGTVKLYVNGVSVALATTGTTTNPIAYVNTNANNTQDLGIGTDFYDQKLRNFNGQIDEVRLWNTVRSDAQLKILKDRNFCNRTGLVAYYQFNENLVDTCINGVGSSGARDGIIKTISSGTVTRQTTGIDLTTTGNILYVKTGVANGNGTSWANAFVDLQDALALARVCNTVSQIWVAAGTYYPTSGTDRTLSFQLINNVGLYGGFVGNETQLSQRNWVNNETILSGDIDKDNVLDAQNSYHVFYHLNTASNKITSSAILNGFTIMSGNANATTATSSNHHYGGGMMNLYASPTVENCIFTNNYAYYNGAGVYNSNANLLSFTNCYFGGNNADSGGGAYNTDSDVSYMSCIFMGNYTSGYGGGCYSYNSSSFYTNCSFSGNYSYNLGGGIYDNASVITSLNNCILWGNSISVTTSSNLDKQYKSTGGNIGMNNCIIQDFNLTNPPFICNSCGNINPLFQIQPTASLGATGDLRLKYASPAINAGTFNTTTTDYLGNPRTGVPDIGAYEVVIAGVPNIYVDSSRAVSGAGHTWAAAFKTFSEATDGAWAFPTIQKVFVAKGTYTPQSLPYNMGINRKGTAIVSTNNRDKTFHIRQGLELYGGYPTGGGTQNVALNPSVLNGKGVGGVATDSAYHVVVIDSSANWNIANDTTKLIGFTIKNGKANGNFDFTVNGNQFNRFYGGGVAIYSGANVLKDNVIQDNTTSYKGGGLWIYRGRNFLINNVIKNNSAFGGGGAFVEEANSTFKNNIFYQNKVSGFGRVDTQSGGGMLCNNSKSLIVNNLFAENTASNVGGGLSLVSCFDTIHSNTFYNNKLLFNDSEEGSAGGGLFTLGEIDGDLAGPNYVSLKNNIFWKNMITNDTTLIFSDALLAVVSGTVENNIFQLDSLNSVNVSNYSTLANAPLIQNNKYKKNPRFLNGNNLLGADNQFRTSDDGLQLTGCSPAINSGLSLTSLGNTDVAGSPRIVYNKTDLGAYEYAGSSGCTIMSMSSGMWENINIWNIDRIPFQKDNVILDNNHIINITTNAASAKTLQYRPNSRLNFGSGLARFSLGL